MSRVTHPGVLLSLFLLAMAAASCSPKPQVASADPAEDKAPELVKRALANLARGGSAMELAQKRAAFESIQPLSDAQYTASWTNERDYRGQPSGDAIRELTERLGLKLKITVPEDQLAIPVRAAVRGRALAESLSMIARDLGAFIEFPAVPDGAAGGRSHDPVATLKLGRPDWPHTFVGPFVVTLEKLDEYVPYARGKLDLTVRAFAVHPGVLRLMSDLRQSLKILGVMDPEGTSLLIEDDISYRKVRVAVDAFYENSVRAGLKNLLRHVAAMAHVRGVQTAVVPEIVQTVVFDSLKQGDKQQAGNFEVRATHVGEFTAFAILAADEHLKNLVVRCWAEDATGCDLGILAESTGSMGSGRLQTSLQMPQVPGFVRLKLITAKVVEYPFAMNDIPLKNHSLMPDQLLELSFGDHDKPVEVEVAGFEESDVQLPKAKLVVHNRSNKAVARAHVELIYLDSAGKEKSRFPCILSGKGDIPLAAAGDKSDTKTSAFFRPAQSAKTQVEVFRVEFVDGTRWTPGG